MASSASQTMPQRHYYCHSVTCPLTYTAPLHTALRSYAATYLPSYTPTEPDG